MCELAGERHCSTNFIEKKFSERFFTLFVDD